MEPPYNGHHWGQYKFNAIVRYSEAAAIENLFNVQFILRNKFWGKDRVRYKRVFNTWPLFRGGR